MKKETESAMNLKEIIAIAALADRYLYLKEKCERIYEKLTLAGKGLEQIGGIHTGTKERILTVYAESKRLLSQDAKRLEWCRRRICDRIRESESLKPDEVQTLLMRLEDRSIREIAIAMGRSDGTIVNRIKRCGNKLFPNEPTEKSAEEFYNCLSRLREASKEGEHL